MHYFVANVFTGKNCRGNPAGVCLPGEWPEPELMQKIAAENGLPETAFVVGGGAVYELKWFTPEEEMDLCGHATLATACVLFNYYEKDAQNIGFLTMSGRLSVRREGGLYIMDLPSRPPVPEEIFSGLSEAAGARILECGGSRDLMVLLEDEKTVENLAPDLGLLKNICNYPNFIFTAKGESCDFVSRFFTPGSVIPEDPVTGSAHCTLVPYWSKKLGKSKLFARQLSERGGELYCENMENRVIISGSAGIYLTGEIFPELL